MKKVALGEICILKTGKTPPTSEIKYFNGDVNWYTPGDLNGRKFLQKSSRTITELAFEEKQASQFQENVLLLTTIGEIGKIGITTSLCSSNQQITALIPTNEVNVNFLYYAIKTIIPTLKEYANNAVVPILNNSILSKIQIPLPPLHVQNRISEILDLADLHRQKTKELLLKYDLLAQSLFIDMFGDPVANPKNWEVKKLKELSTHILSGNTPLGGEEVYINEGITFFRSQNVWKNRLVYDDVAYIDNETHSKMKKSSLKHKDILMTKTGRINTENSSLGRAALFLGENDSANINGHVYLIRLLKNECHNFILHILTTNSYRNHIRSVCVGGIDKRQLNKEHIEEFPIIYPPLSLQNQFADRMQEIEKQKELASRAAQKAEELFGSLLQKAFSGELVPE